MPKDEGTVKKSDKLTTPLEARTSRRCDWAWQAWASRPCGEATLLTAGARGPQAAATDLETSVDRLPSGQQTRKRPLRRHDCDHGRRRTLPDGPRYGSEAARDGSARLCSSKFPESAIDVEAVLRKTPPGRIPGRLSRESKSAENKLATLNENGRYRPSASAANIQTGK